MKRVTELLTEARSEIIGGVVVLLISWLGTVYTTVGWRPLVIGGLVILWVAYGIFILRWLFKQKQPVPPPASPLDLPVNSPGPLTSLPEDHEMSPFYPCFISYSDQDEAFAQKLYVDLRQNQVRCWFEPEDMKIGDKKRQTREQAVKAHAKLLLILSAHSIASEWVEKEVETAFEEEGKRKQVILFPIRLDMAVMETGQAWAADIRRTRHIGDFSRWPDSAAYERAFGRLLRDLRMEEGGKNGE